MSVRPCVCNVMLSTTMTNMYVSASKARCAKHSLGKGALWRHESLMYEYYDVIDKVVGILEWMN